jgi:soluble lytic murein transglycosylase-like protein
MACLFSSHSVTARHLLLLALLVCGAARADIYRTVGENGTTVFTNVPAPGRPYELYVKEPAKPAPPMEAAAPGRADASRAARGRYATHIRAAAQASDVDAALIHAVISAESGYNPSARSPKGAVGLMQLMPDTAARYSVANRLDPEQNIQGGARYLRDLLRMFNNDLQLVLAAYNAGEKAVLKYGNRIPPYPETAAYVPRVLKYYRSYRAGAQG